MTAFGPFVQAAYLAQDAKNAAQHFAKQFGAGPFFLLENIEPEQATYLGAPARLTHTSAYGWHGDIMVEIVQPLVEGASVFDGFMGRLHHMAAFAPDLDHALEMLDASGCPTAARAHFGETQFCFVDTRATLGHYLELYQESAGLHEFYAMVRAAGQDWDGRDAVRALAL